MDFKELHNATLPKLEQLLHNIFPAGKIQGREFKIGNLRGEAGDSLSINLDSGMWSDFATGEKGGDFTSLLAAKLAFSQTDAGLLVKTMLDDPAVGRKELKFILGGGDKRSKATPIAHSGPDPVWTPDSFIINEWGAPASTWEYRNSTGRLVFVVCRYGDDSAKTYRPWTWDGYRWQCRAYDEGRPLYNLKGLAELPNARVLIVEGEKCAEVAKKRLAAWFVPVTWAGGAKAIAKSVWTPLAGRHLVIWPDADPPGYKAALELAHQLEKTALSIGIVSTTDLPAGADIADMDMDGATIVSWIDANTIEHRMPDKSDKLPEGGEWKKQLQLSDKGAVRPTHHNVSIIVQHDPYFVGRWWMEEWDGRFWINDQQAEERDLFRARVHLSHAWNIEIGTDTMYQALEAVLVRRNSIQDWMRGLVWDGFPRFDLFASEVMKLPNNPYAAEVLQMLVCGMVARAMDPGCKFDYCIILRGKQGIKKTWLFEKLGGKRYVMLYSHTSQDKDVLGAMATGWLVNVEELLDTKISLRELKSMISSTMDTWRRPYHREMTCHPKRCILVGTTDAEADFLDDMAGYRRFLIIECNGGDFDLDLFDEMRDQLFAEAYHRWQNVPEWFRFSADSLREAQTITSNCEVEDAWAVPVMEFLKDKDTTTMLDVLTNALFITTSMHDPRITKRVHRVLISLGFGRTRIRIGGKEGRLRAYSRREPTQRPPSE